MHEKSGVEQFWDAVSVKFNDNRKWSELNLQQQSVFIDGINRILAVLHRMV